ncbi:hypothetical protein JCM8547_008425 [Rhodosporidiobolus lusitaniae]
MATVQQAAKQAGKQTRLASTQPFFPNAPSPSSPLLTTLKPPSSLWYTARPSLQATLTSLEHTLTTTRTHLFKQGLLPSISSSIAHDAEFHAVLPHPRARRWRTAKDMATYLRTGTDLKTSQYKRLTAVLAHLEGILPYARVADSLTADADLSAANTAPSLVVDPVTVATGRPSSSPLSPGSSSSAPSSVRGEPAHGLHAQLEELLARFQQAAAVSSTGVTVERVVGKDRRLGKQDEQQRTMAVGRRKESGARVWIVPTQPPANGGGAPLGRVLVNTRPINEYFSQPSHRHDAVKALGIVDSLGAFNVFALVKGGGQAAQSEAVAMGLARALAEWESCEVEAGKREEGEYSWRDLLKRAKLIERDPRVVERKKTGLVKARKAWTWVKR